MFSYNIHWMLSKILKIGKEFFFQFSKWSKQKITDHRESQRMKKNLKPVSFRLVFHFFPSFFALFHFRKWRKNFETKTKPGIGPSIYRHTIREQNRKGKKERKSSSIIDSSQTHYERINYFFFVLLQLLFFVVVTVIVNINISDLGIKYQISIRFSVVLFQIFKQKQPTNIELTQR